MNTDRFFQQLIEEARSRLPYTAGDVSRAVRVALQDAHAELAQEQCVAAIDALGGHDTVVAVMTAALTPIEPPSRADIEAQMAFERKHGASLPTEENT